MLLPRSVVERVEREYPEADRMEILELLSCYGTESSGQGIERVLLDILVLAGGRKEEIAGLVDRARRDYRDIILWAEYPAQARLDTPEKKQQFNQMLERFGAGWKIEE